MSRQQCGKQIICAVAEAAMGASENTEFITDDELKQAIKTRHWLDELRIKLAERADRPRD